MRKVKFIVALFLGFMILCIPGRNLEAQDVHFSQNFMAPLSINPALAGLDHEDGRLIFNHRGQWNSFTNAYKTNAFSFDLSRGLKQSQFSLGSGIMFLTDVAGNGNFGTKQFTIPLNIQYQFPKSEVLISLGLSGSFTQFGLEVDKLSFGDQFNGSVFDPYISTGEAYSGNDLGFADLGAGLVITLPVQSWKISGGLALSHINQPEVSFSGNRFSTISRKWTAFTRLSKELKNSMVFMPSVYYFHQAGVPELVAGSSLAFSPRNEYFHTMETGLFYRNRDALIVYYALYYLNYRLGFSYDVNVSSLGQVSRGRGGFELSLQYLFQRRQAKPEYSPMYCPELI